MDATKSIRSQLSDQGISIRDLAARTGISYQKLWNKLNGRTSLTNEDLATIAKAVGIEDVSKGQFTQPGVGESTREREGQAVRRGRKGLMDARGRRFAIIVSRWNEFVTNELLDGALDELRRHGEPDVEIVRVPGTWEVPVAAKLVLEARRRPAAIIALGCITQGQTAHAGILAGDVGSALMSLQVQSGVPIAWGILTPEDQDQAIDRAGLKMGNKGREAALAAIEMAGLVEQMT